MCYPGWPKEIQIWLFPLGNVWNFTLVIWTGYFAISENPWNILVFSCQIGTSSSHIFPPQLLSECEPWSCYGVEARKHQDFSGPSCSDLCLPDRVDMGANRPKWFLFAGDQGEKMWKGYGWWRKGSGFMVDFPHPTVRKSWVDGKWWKWIGGFSSSNC